MSTNARKRVKPLILTIAMAGLLIVPASLTVQNTYAADTTTIAPTITPTTTVATPLQDAFQNAAQEFGVPQNVLMAVAYNESLWNQHKGEPSMSGGYGIMHLTQINAQAGQKGDDDAITTVVSNDSSQHTLDTAANLLGVDPSVLKEDSVQNIRGGAALLAQYAKDTVGTLPQNLAAWYGAIAKYSGSDVDVVAQGFADDVYATLQTGEERTTNEGEHAVLAATAVTPDKTTANGLYLRNNKSSGVDCPNGLDCQYVPAAYSQFGATNPTSYGNYDLANRPSDGNDIRYIVIHDAEEGYQDTINTFLLPSYTSAHYVVDSGTGQVTEMVRPENVAWQAGNWYVNSHSIGIEHSGYAVEGGTWYSEQMYHASAKLVKYLADRYNIPLDRGHILGHDNVPGTSASTQSSMHWDPAAYWNWSHYFDLLGASFQKGNGHGDRDIVTINPNYQTNQPALTYQGSALTPQPSDFVYLYTAPSFDAPLVSDPALHSSGVAGTTAINDWGDKAVQGQEFYKVDSTGDWTAIDYGGQKAWFYNPNGDNTVSGEGLLLTPKAGLTSIPVYGTAYPEASAYTGTGVPVRAQRALQYTIPAGQLYVANDLVQSDSYSATLYNSPSANHVVKGKDLYYEISFNHRVAFVKASDVDVVRGSEK
jgi:N-acetyl-anhydromuramyl-L-alanine amidase AmpD